MLNTAPCVATAPGAAADAGRMRRARLHHDRYVFPARLRVLQRAGIHPVSLLSGYLTWV